MEVHTFIYEHPRFGNLRGRIIDGQPKFVVADACRALDIKNYRDAVSRLDDDEKDLVEISISPTGVALTDTQGGYQKMLVVNEPGLYRLIFSSRKKEAREFQRWVYHEVLPSIRKHGYYSFTAETAPVAKPAKVKNPNRVAGQLTPAGLYAAKIGGKVKIGHCHDMEQRLSQIKGSKETPYYRTVLFPRKVARLLEKVCHKIFAPYALGNELFDIEYDEACRIIRALEQFAIGLTKVVNFGRDDKVLAIAEKFLVKATNIIADN